MGDAFATHARRVAVSMILPRASAEMLLGIGAAPRWSNLRLKIPEKFLECSGEFSTTPLVATKLQKFIPLIVVELGP